jgi:hypothetical protein
MKNEKDVNIRFVIGLVVALLLIGNFVTYGITGAYFKRQIADDNRDFARYRESVIAAENENRQLTERIKAIGISITEINDGLDRPIANIREAIGLIEEVKYRIDAVEKSSILGNTVSADYRDNGGSLDNSPR